MPNIRNVQFFFPGDFPRRRGSAIVITLAILLLVTILVLSLCSMITLERAGSHGAFENQRAKEFDNIALDEVVASLRDNIPTNTAWAAAPGRLVAYNVQGGTFIDVPLHSGQSVGATSGTGQVDLNAPVLSSATGQQYPIVPTNSEYTTSTPMPVAWVEVLADGTNFIRSGIAATVTPSSADPIVGRYAYWVDTETSKVNINTAGKGQSLYSFNMTTNSGKVDMSTNDSQNLTSSPSRVDLSELDGAITPTQSVATYHYTYGGFYQGDLITNLITTPKYPPVPNLTNSPPQGGQRFNTIEEWPLMTSDLTSNVAITPVTALQVEQNRFYLTTRSRSPELTPWGFNKFWLQNADEIANVRISSGATNNPSTSGNKLNAKGYPIFPASNPNNSAQWVPGRDYPSSGLADSRYYVTPYYPAVGPNTNAGFQVYGTMAMAQPAGPPITSPFINNMMVQLNRTDWPGFAGKSFVAKYGQSECEDFAFNLACLLDTTVGPGGYGLDFNYRGSHGQSGDYAGNYGAMSQYSLGGQRLRVLSGVGEWPYLNQMSASFSASTNGTIITNVPTATYPYATPVPVPTKPGMTYYTKGALTNGWASPALPSHRIPITSRQRRTLLM